eukprot:CAMPEP_0196580992 /NCGR_PEP_ID=MMETSP1081-20130531/31876_1 /TAXON_ID=36882 /ORGANISM="Pyramimonas amylifera, Strain CCMP720" /LENGTH=57 /DNA_ID=CAMNT_0041901065 /DNA_START=41 /DNA_END=210 /DNA_ORIENTATION=+
MINLQGNFLGDEGLRIISAAIACSPHLKAINLGMNRMGGDDFDHVQAFADAMVSNNS